MTLPSRSWRWGGAVLAVAAAMATAACGGDDTPATSASTEGAAAPAATPAATPAAACGPKEGAKATGAPIKLGTIYTKQPGLDFSAMPAAEKAFYDCVNANGGIHGRPITLIAADEQTNPQQVSSLATKLVESDKVLALVGNASILDCAVNGQYYAKQRLSVIVAGIPNDCFASPAIAPVNSGPLYSDLGAAQYLIDDQGAKSLIMSTTAGPGAEASLQPALTYARSKGLKASGSLEKVPISDADAVVLKLVDQAGEGGGVVLAYTPPDALKLLKAAEAQGLIDKVHWACPTSCNDASLVKALGPAWDGKLAVNAELSLPEADGADNALYRAVMAKYAPGQPLGSFGQMGFLAAKIAADTLQDVPDDKLDREGVNAAIRAVHDYKTSFLCKPWYFGDLDAHIPSNTNRTITPKGGTFVEAKGCTQMPAVTPQMKAVRAYETEHGS
jgi:branched-chain amino acid transport system substrate-binding protein